MLSRRIQFGVLGVGCLLCCLGGCNKPKGNVSGKVTFEGKPLVYGSVVMAGEDNLPLTAAIQRDGTYKVQGLPFGPVRVAVHSPDPHGRYPKRPLRPGLKESEAKLPPPPPSEDIQGWFPIPANYKDLNQSSLSLTIEREETTFDIDLK